MMENNYLMHWRVETDAEVKGEYGTIERAIANASSEDYVIEVLYKEVLTKIIKVPEPKIVPEIKRSDWLVLSGETIKRFCIDADPLDLSIEEKKDPFTHRVKIYARFDEYLPFSDVDDIKTMVLQRKKFGARLAGDVAHTTDWVLHDTTKQAKMYLQTTHKVSINNL